MSDVDLVVLVDDEGREIGTAPKISVHDADTPLHLAFSCHVVNHAGEILVTRRALSKATWPGVWTNSFCGHPRPAEPTVSAVRRRADHELGLTLVDVELVLPDFRYRATDASGIVEHEICPRVRRTRRARARPQSRRGGRCPLGRPGRSRHLGRHDAVGLQPVAGAAGPTAAPLRRRARAGQTSVMIAPADRPCAARGDRPTPSRRHSPASSIDPPRSATARAALAKAISPSRGGRQAVPPRSGGRRGSPASGANPPHPPAFTRSLPPFELLHTAFVAHDDVIDHDTVRRGIPNVVGEFRARAGDMGADAAGAALLGDAAAILAGDLLLHEAERLVALAELEPPVRRQMLDIVDDAVFVSVAGELADVENAVAAELADSAALIDAAHNKTAVYSFTAPLRAGAVLAGAGDAAEAALERFGGRLGLAYQLVDDLIGAFGTTTQAGRDEGGDLREAKRTPLVALASETVAWARVSSAIALAYTGPIAVREAQRMLDESGARAGLVALVDQTLAEARSAARSAALPGEVRALLLSLADAVQERIP